MTGRVSSNTVLQSALLFPSQTPSPRPACAGANGTLLGLCLAVNCNAEVPVFYYSGALIKRLGVELALNLAMGAYCVRLVAYAVS